MSFLGRANERLGRICASPAMMRSMGAVAAATTFGLGVMTGPVHEPVAQGLHEHGFAGSLVAHSVEAIHNEQQQHHDLPAVGLVVDLVAAGALARGLSHLRQNQK